MVTTANWKELMLNRTLIVLIISGLSLTTFTKESLSDPEDFQYGTTIAMEGAGVALSVAMAKSAPTLPQKIAYTAAAIGTAGALGMTIYNWIRADQNGDPNSFDDTGGFDGGSGSTTPVGSNPGDLGNSGSPTDSGSGSFENFGSEFDSNNFSASDSTRSGNADVALDLLNPDPDSGFGAESLNQNRDLASNSSNGSIGGGLNTSDFDKKNENVKSLEDAIAKELSTWNPKDIEKLLAGDKALTANLFDSLGMDGNLSGLDSSMFSQLLNGMFKGEKDQFNHNGVLASELVNKKLSIWETIKKSTVVAATEYHPTAFVIPSPNNNVIPAPVIPAKAGIKRMDPRFRGDDMKFSMMPRRIGVGDVKEK